MAVGMMEPGPPPIGVHGPIVDAEAEFLRPAQRLCRENGAVLILDEIITGFRSIGRGACSTRRAWCRI